MTIRFNRRVSIIPGLRLNLSKRGASVSVGHRGGWITVGSRGARATVGIPGTGVFWTEHVSRGHAPPTGQHCAALACLICAALVALALMGAR